MSLNAFLGQFIDDKEVIDEWISKFVKQETLPKGTQLLETFNSSKKIFFIEKGLARTYYLKDGKDITHHFFKENEISAPIESIFFGKQSPYGLELLEKSDIAIIVYERLEELKSQFPVIEKIQNLFLVNVLYEFSERLYAIQFQTAKDRYSIMIKDYPDILLRAPLGHIASYLGITQQTLSVIRAEI